VTLFTLSRIPFGRVHAAGHYRPRLGLRSARLNSFGRACRWNRGRDL